jgi:hypothetical protein
MRTGSACSPTAEYVTPIVTRKQRHCCPAHVEDCSKLPGHAGQQLLLLPPSVWHCCSCVYALVVRQAAMAMIAVACCWQAAAAVEHTVQAGLAAYLEAQGLREVGRRHAIVCADAICVKALQHRSI